MQGPAPRRIVLCADDYGIAPGVNAAIRELIAAGRLNAASAMVVAPSLDAGAAESLLAAVGGRSGEMPAAIGLHLTLTAPFAPLSEGYRPLHAGAFFGLGGTFLRALARQLDAASLEAEIDAQFRRFAVLFGRPPDFVDGHQHVHLLPQIREAVIAAAARHAPAAWLRQCGVPAGRLPADAKGAVVDALSRRFRRLAAARALATNPAFAGTYAFRPDADFAVLFPRFLAGLPDGAVVMCHPGHVDAELARLDPVTHLRAREFAYLAGDTFPLVLARAGVTLRQ